MSNFHAKSAQLEVCYHLRAIIAQLEELNMYLKRLVEQGEVEAKKPKKEKD